MTAAFVTSRQSMEGSNMAIETKPFDAAKYLTDEADQLELIRDAIASGHAGYIAAAIGTIARARGIAAVAEDAGLNRQTLHRALSDKGNPTLDTLVRVLDTLGLRLDVMPKPMRPASQRSIAM